MKYEQHTFQNMAYIIRYPNGYEEGKRYPVIMVLHGAGTRGTDVEVLKNNAFFAETDKYEQFPFITVAPLCHTDTWFDLFETLRAFVKYMGGSSFIDIERFYLIGPSMGGYTTWALAMSMPEYFAAIVPICGGGMYWNAGRLVNVPVWAFHGEKDLVVFVEESKKMVNAVNANGGNAKLTIYPENEHNAWSDTYSNYEVFEWLLSHKNENAKQLKNEYADQKIYG